MPSSKNSTPREQIDKSKQQMTTANIQRFPLTEMAYYAKFNFISYNRFNPKVQATETGTTAEIILPLPFNLKEQYHICYSGTEFSWTEGVVDTYRNVLAQPGSILSLDAANRSNAEDALQAFTRSVLGNRNLGPVSDIGLQINRFAGNAVNPHEVNVFKGVSLRTHTFNWQFSPTSTDEAVALKNIKDEFRARMHPTRRDQYILGFPDEVYVTMHGSDFLYPVFKAVVEDAQLDYTDGRPNAWFTDGAPVTLTFQVTLQEVETLTREDFAQGSTASG